MQTTKKINIFRLSTEDMKKKEIINNVKFSSKNLNNYVLRMNKKKNCDNWAVYQQIHKCNNIEKAFCDLIFQCKP